MPGHADLPLHGGHVPPWMLKLMERMAETIAEAIVELHGPEALVQGLADPVWFQAFNNIIGMDWDSSGSTTVLLGILKSVTWRRPELGILVLGGKGARMRLVPEEAEKAGGLLGVDPEKIKFFSRAAARLDSTLLQDGYTLYHHAVVLSERSMIVVQQGMNEEQGMARRYHLDRAIVEEPHSAVAGTRGQAINATARESREARRLYVDLLNEDPRRLARLIGEASAMLKPNLLDYTRNRARLAREKPYYRPVIPDWRLRRQLEELARNPPSGEEDLLTVPGLGPKTLRALALVADLIYSVPTSTRDPVSHPLDPFLYAYAVGGKDGVPYPYDRETVERVIVTLEEAVREARLGSREKMRALERLRLLVRGTPRGRV